MHGCLVPCQVSDFTFTACDATVCLLGRLVRSGWNLAVERKVSERTVGSCIVCALQQERTLGIRMLMQEIRSVGGNSIFLCARAPADTEEKIPRAETGKLDCQ